MEKKQLATEWLMEQLYENIEIIGGGNVLDDLLDQAKEKEKENIFEAYGDEQSNLQDDGSWKRTTAEQYYKETFKPE
jgi:hypothetical protein